MKIQLVLEAVLVIHLKRLPLPLEPLEQKKGNLLLHLTVQQIDSFYLEGNQVIKKQ